MGPTSAALKSGRSSAGIQQGLSEIQLAEVFVDVLSTLHTQGRVRLRDLVDDLPSGGEIEMIGWHKGDTALVIPEAAYRRVAMFVREAGDHWAPSLRELHKELVNRGYARATTDGRDAGQWRVGPDRKRRRGWLMPLTVFGIGPGPQSASGVPPDSSEGGGSPADANQLELEDKLNRRLIPASNASSRSTSTSLRTARRAR
jgi:hypothetical protein